MIFAISYSYMEAVLAFLFLPRTGLFAAATYWSNQQHEVTTTRARLGYGLRSYAPYGRSVARALTSFFVMATHGPPTSHFRTMLEADAVSYPGGVLSCDMRWCYKDRSMVLRKLTYCVAPGSRPI
jgi:hypothetical protein